MNKKIVTAYAVLLLMPLFFTGCASRVPEGTLTASDEEVGFFAEEVEILYHYERSDTLHTFEKFTKSTA